VLFEPVLDLRIAGVVSAEIAGINVGGGLDERGHDEEEEERVVIADSVRPELRKVDLFQSPR
jgi:hypothetical protein